MLINELLTLMDREADMLTAENNHSAAALMRCGAAKIRELARTIDNGCPQRGRTFDVSGLVSPTLNPPNMDTGGRK